MPRAMVVNIEYSTRGADAGPPPPPDGLLDCTLGDLLAIGGGDLVIELRGGAGVIRLSVDGIEDIEADMRS